MTTTQQLITIIIMSICVISTRALPFILFRSKQKTPRFVLFLGKYLAGAVFGMLIIYCIKEVHFFVGNHGVSQVLGILACVLLHIWKKNMLLTIAGGTCIYMILIRTIPI